MKALILAAGKGERLGNLTTNRPKGLVHVASRPLLEYTLDFLNNSAVEEIAIVGGYHAEKIQEFAKNKNIKFFNNTRFHEGSIRTIMTAIDWLDSDFVLLNADHIYPRKMFDVYLSKMNGLTIACDFDRTLVADDMKIKLNSAGFLTKIRKDLQDFDGGYIGSSYIPYNKLDAYKKAVVDSYEIYGSKANAETVIGHLAANDHEIGVADLSGIGWLEVDTQEDRANAEKIILSKNWPDSYAKTLEEISPNVQDNTQPRE